MANALSKLVNARSTLISGLEAYLHATARTADRTAWWRDGRAIRCSEIAIGVVIHKRLTLVAWDELPESSDLMAEAGRKTEVVQWSRERRTIRRAVLLGDPGSGKSFSLAILVADFARDAISRLAAYRCSPADVELPIHLQAVDLARPDLPEDPAEAILEMLHDRYGLSSYLTSWIRVHLRSENCYIVIDAFDALNQDQRNVLGKRLQIIEEQCWSTRILIACRTAGYDHRVVPLTVFAEYRLVELQPRDVPTFIFRWFSDRPDLGNALAKLLESHAPLRNACRNAMILTLACLAHEEHKVTSATSRSQLYEYVLRGLVRRGWKTAPLSRADPHIDDMVALLTEITGLLCSGGPRSEFFNDEVLSAIAHLRYAPIPHALRSIGGLTADQIRYVPVMLRDELLDCGILHVVGTTGGGQSRLAFLHRTFMEFLLAGSMSADLNSPTDTGWRWVDIDKHAWDPEWQGTIVFLAGRLRPPNRLLELIMDSAVDDLFRHRLCLAAQCLPEAILSRKQPEANPTERLQRLEFGRRIDAVARNIVSDVWLLYRDLTERGVSYKHVTEAMKAIALCAPDNLTPILMVSPRSPEWAAASRLMADLGSLAALEPILAHLERFLASSDLEERRDAAAALASLGAAADTPLVLATVMRLLEHEAPDARVAAVRIVRGLGPSSTKPHLVGRLIEFLNGEDGTVRQEAADALARLDGSFCNDQLLRVLFRMLVTADWRTQVAAIKVVGAIGNAATQEIVDAMVAVFRDPDADAAVWAEAVIAIENIGASSAIKDAVTRICELLSHPDPAVRAAAARAAGNFRPAAVSGALVEPLLACLTDPAPPVRAAAAWAVGELGQCMASDRVVHSLVDLVHDKLASREAGQALGRIGLSSEQVASCVQHLLRQTVEAPMISVVLAVAEIGAVAGTVPVLEWLLTLLRDNKHPSTQAAAAYAAGKIGPIVATPAITTALTALAVVEGWPQVQAIRALGRVGRNATNAELLRLLPELYDDYEGSVRNATAEAVGNWMQDGVRFFSVGKEAWRTTSLASLYTIGTDV